MGQETRDVVCLLEAGAAAGESPVWVAEEKALYWIDIHGPALYRYDPATGDNRSWTLDEPIGSFALRQAGGVIAGLRSGFAFIDLTTGEVEHLHDPEPRKPGNRLNDGRCDRRGRFWAGSMAEDMQSRDGALYRFGPDRSCHAMVSDIAVSNGLAWSPDNKTMYHTDSPQRTVWAWDFDIDTGAVCNRRVFAEAARGEGYPDGAAIDEEGCYWSARWNGGRLVRHASDGRVIETVMMPVRKPTMCAFGGDRLDILYVTSATQGMTAEQRRAEPQAGGLFALEIGVRGLPEPRFAG